MATIMCMREGLQKGASVLLEPIMKTEVVVPEEFLGDVLGQLTSRRGEVQGMGMRPGNAQAINALVPLAELFGYATELRLGYTGARGVHNGI